MSKLFNAGNRRYYSLKKMEYIRPIVFPGHGNVAGVNNLEAASIQAGRIGISSTGDITNVRTLSATGTISTQANFVMKEFTSSGKIQSDGPLFVLANGFYDYTSVGSSDADFAGTAPYYTQDYPTQLPDAYPHKVYIWPISNDNTSHLTITQGTSIYIYNFGVGNYTPTELVSQFNNSLQAQNQSPITLAYDATTDVFTFGVDDTIGQAVQGPPAVDVVRNYTLEFQIGTQSQLLCFMGFITKAQAQGTDLVHPVTTLSSTGRRLSSTHATAFAHTAGASQGYYCGGRNKDLSYSAWSPVSQTWVGPSASQSATMEFFKTLDSGRSDNGLTNEQVLVDILGPSNLLEAKASLTVPIFDINTSPSYTISSTTSQRRQVVNSFLAISDEGYILLTGSEDEPNKRTTTRPGALIGNKPNKTHLVLRNRDPKQLSAGPGILFQGSSDNATALSNANEMVLAQIKAVPAPFDATTRDTSTGGQLVFYTASTDSLDTTYNLNNPVEAMRVNHNQQVEVGALSTTPNITTLPLAPKLAVHGNVLAQQSLQVKKSLVVSSTDVTIVPTDTALRVEGPTRITQDLTVDGNLYCPSIQTLQTQLHDLVSILGDQYSEIQVVASPTPTYSGITVTDRMTVDRITGIHPGTSIITMNTGVFTTLSFVAGTGSTLAVSSFINCPTITTNNLTASTNITAASANIGSLSISSMSVTGSVASAGGSFSTLSFTSGSTDTLLTNSLIFQNGSGNSLNLASSLVTPSAYVGNLSFTTASGPTLAATNATFSTLAFQQGTGNTLVVNGSATCSTLTALTSMICPLASFTTLNFISANGGALTLSASIAVPNVSFSNAVGTTLTTTTLQFNNATGSTLTSSTITFASGTGTSLSLQTLTSSTIHGNNVAFSTATVTCMTSSSLYFNSAMGTSLTLTTLLCPSVSFSSGYAQSLSLTSLTAANMDFSTAIGTSMYLQTLTSSNLTFATGAGTSLSLTSLTSANLTFGSAVGTSLTFATGDGTSLSLTSLTSSNITFVSGIGTSLTSSNITFATGAGTSLSLTSLTSANITFVSGIGTSLTSSNITFATGAGTSLSLVSLTSSTITFGSCVGTSLTSSNLTFATGAGTSLSLTSLTSANITFGSAVGTSLTFSNLTFDTGAGTSLSLTLTLTPDL